MDGISMAELSAAHGEKGPAFEEMVELGRRAARAFDAVEQRPWTIEATMIEFMKQVGDLARDVMTFERYYLPARAETPEYRTSREDIGDELADIFYCLIRIADHYGIDLAEAHIAARQAELRLLGIGEGERGTEGNDR
jgi:NTP pyrophosphatase (non-canonical NTP hydrolase)